MWWSVAAVVLVVLAGLVVWRAATAGDLSAPPGITAPTTHDSAVPGVVPRPTVSAHRAGSRAEFRWRAPDAPRPATPSSGGCRAVAAAPT